MKFRVETLLKRDPFSETQLGVLEEDPATRVIRRRLDRLPLWSRPVGRYLARREVRALERLADVRGVPRLLYADRDVVLRSWLDGAPLQLAEQLDRQWVADAHQLLREMHRRGVTHNDLAKPQNWLVTPEGHAAVIDMQLASVHRRRGMVFRIARYEDLRHLLKQKRRFAPELLTPTAQRLLARRSLPSRVWHATGKRLYNYVTRKLLNWSDNEGLGHDFDGQSAAVEAALRAAPDVRDVAILSYSRPGGTGIYAFVESDAGQVAKTDPAPDLLQIVRALPRSESGRIRTDVLALVAENRIGELDGLLEKEHAIRETLAPIIEGRLNLTDRYIRQA